LFSSQNLLLILYAAEKGLMRMRKRQQNFYFEAAALYKKGLIFAAPLMFFDN